MAYTLQDLENRVLFHLREDGYEPAGGAPTFNVDFPKAFMDADLNHAERVFMLLTGMAPMLTDRIVSVPATSLLDFPLPTGLNSLYRIDYKQVNQTARLIIQVTMDEFDQVTGMGAVTNAVGVPRYYREPFGNANPTYTALPGLSNGTVRLYPYPTAGAAAAGDVLQFYGSFNVPMVNPADYPSIPELFHEALASFVLARYWRKKNDATLASAWHSDFGEYVAAGKKFQADFTKGEQPSFDDETTSGDVLFGRI